MISLWPKRRWVRVVVAAAVVLLVPYLFSRLAGPWRCLSVYSKPAPGVSESPAPNRPLRIACYNIAHGRGIADSNWAGGGPADRIARLEQIAELLRQIDADVVVLNEVDFDSSWSYSVDQARYLARKAGYAYWAEQRNLDFRILTWKWRFGNALLSKYPIENAQVADLPGYSAWETILAGKKRGLICDIKFGDDVVRVIGAHLSHRSESLRVDSAKLLTEIAADSTAPTIVAGDLNSTPSGFPQSNTDPTGANAMETFDNSGYFQRTPSSPPDTDDDLTFHSARPCSVIDWILIPRHWQYLRYAVEPSELSDHRPVYAEVGPIRSAKK